MVRRRSPPPRRSDTESAGHWGRVGIDFRLRGAFSRNLIISHSLAIMGSSTNETVDQQLLKLLPLCILLGIIAVFCVCWKIEKRKTRASSVETNDVEGNVENRIDSHLLMW
eukprot:TCALIF_11587-PA protein Name:"Protein of unknown function" AED:0.18 eAED:0.18 QI:0/0/0.5/0.5/1/1/2/9/110